MAIRGFLILSLCGAFLFEESEMEMLENGNPFYTLKSQGNNGCLNIMPYFSFLCDMFVQPYWLQCYLDPILFFVMVNYLENHRKTYLLVRKNKNTMGYDEEKNSENITKSKGTSRLFGSILGKIKLGIAALVGGKIAKKKISKKKPSPVATQPVPPRQPAAPPKRAPPSPPKRKTPSPPKWSPPSPPKKRRHKIIYRPKVIHYVHHFFPNRLRNPCWRPYCKRIYKLVFRKRPSVWKNQNHFITII